MASESATGECKVNEYIYCRVSGYATMQMLDMCNLYM